MGAFYQRIAIAATAAGPFEELEALVDTKTTYTQLPGSILEGLGIKPTLRGQFETDDGRTIERGLAEVTMRLGDQIHTTLVAFGDSGSLPLLGMVTLTAFRLRINSMQQRLVPDEESLTKQKQGMDSERKEARTWLFPR